MYPEGHWRKLSRRKLSRVGEGSQKQSKIWILHATEVQRTGFGRLNAERASGPNLDGGFFANALLVYEPGALAQAAHQLHTRVASVVRTGWHGTAVVKRERTTEGGNFIMKQIVVAAQTRGGLPLPDGRCTNFAKKTCWPCNRAGPQPIAR